MSTLRTVILAAGQGSRMKSDLPKVLHPICGRPMIVYALDLAASSGIKQPIVVIGHGAEAVKDHLPKEAKVVMQSRQVGTADAVLSAKRALGGLLGDLLILYGDTPLLRRTTVHRLIEAHNKHNATCSLLSAHLADPSGYGRILREASGIIMGIVEETEANSAQRAIREVNVGTFICKAQLLMEALTAVKPSGSTKELFLTRAISYLARQEGTKIQTTRIEETSEALGINSRMDLARATGIIRQRIVEFHLHRGVTIEDPQTTFIDQNVSIGHDTVIRSHSVIETGVSIGRRCSIGPFARLRSGVSVSDDVRVGNFTELVRTKVGPRVRINHVTYLGDATIEEGVNVGAGAITANFDGEKKHHTHVSKGAFIGSNTALIAPVKVGAGAVTGAGSVVTREHDVPPRSIVVGVPAREVGKSAKKTEEKKSTQPKRKPAQTSKRRTAKPKKKLQARKSAKGRKRSAAGRRTRGKVRKIVRKKSRMHRAVSHSRRQGARKSKRTQRKTTRKR